jgi:hypothetical protein
MPRALEVPHESALIPASQPYVRSIPVWIRALPLTVAAAFRSESVTVPIALQVCKLDSEAVSGAAFSLSRLSAERRLRDAKARPDLTPGQFQAAGVLRASDPEPGPAWHRRPPWRFPGPPTVTPGPWHLNDRSAKFLKRNASPRNHEVHQGGLGPGAKGVG